MTRTTDKDFGGVNADADVNKRVVYLNKTYPKVSGLISVHCNSNLFSKVGPFYQKGNATSKQFSGAIAKRYGTVEHQVDFAVLRDTTRTNATTLIELAPISSGWLDKTKDLESTADFIIKGLEDYYSYLFCLRGSKDSLRLYLIDKYIFVTPLHIRVIINGEGN